MTKLTPKDFGPQADQMLRAFMERDLPIEILRRRTATLKRVIARGLYEEAKDRGEVGNATSK